MTCVARLICQIKSLYVLFLVWCVVLLSADYCACVLSSFLSLQIDDEKRPEHFVVRYPYVVRRFCISRRLFRISKRASCVFLACKTEEHRVPIATFARTVGVEPSLLAARERELLAGIRFHLQIQAPHTAVRGLIAELGATGAEGVRPPVLSFPCDMLAGSCI